MQRLRRAGASLLDSTVLLGPPSWDQHAFYKLITISLTPAKSHLREQSRARSILSRNQTKMHHTSSILNDCTGSPEQSSVRGGETYVLVNSSDGTPLSYRGSCDRIQVPFCHTAFQYCSVPRRFSPTFPFAWACTSP